MDSMGSHSNRCDWASLRGPSAPDRIVPDATQSLLLGPCKAMPNSGNIWEHNPYVFSSYVRLWLSTEHVKCEASVRHCWAHVRPCRVHIFECCNDGYACVKVCGWTTGLGYKLSVRVTHRHTQTHTRNQTHIARSQYDSPHHRTQQLSHYRIKHESGAKV